MIIVCQTCSTRLQINGEKSPAGTFTVRCPKCKNTVNSHGPSPASDQSAFAVGSSPATEHPRHEQSPAPAYQYSDDPQPEHGLGNEDAINVLINLLSQGVSKGSEGTNARASWNKRKALICAAEQYREGIARSLSENGYRVYVAEDTPQAVETMRANQLEVVLLEPQFDAGEQGAAFIVREINILRPAQRRRLFFVLVSPSLRTMDAHAAFLNNVNAVVNISEVGDLPRILEVTFREYNELYREFNKALNVNAL